VHITSVLVDTAVTSITPAPTYPGGPAILAIRPVLLHINCSRHVYTALCVASESVLETGMQELFSFILEFRILCYIPKLNPENAKNKLETWEHQMTIKFNLVLKTGCPTCRV